MQFFHYDEGLCVQCMHVGSYDAEPETLEQMDAFAREQGYETDFTGHRRHHEIYLSDPRRTAQEKIENSTAASCSRKINRESSQRLSIFVVRCAILYLSVKFHWIEKGGEHHAA